MDNAVKKIESFVDAYNTLMDKLQGLYKEKSYSTTYPPLTPDQKAEMSDEDIANWENFAKSGMLSYDSNLGGIIDSLRDAVSTNVQPYGESLADFGISTGDYSSGGKLTIDSTKLKQALTSDPDTVIAVFTRTSDSLNGSSSSYSTTGVMNRVNDAINSYINTIKTQTDLIDDYSDKYNELLEELSDKEDFWWTKYTNLESSLSTLQAQMSSITSYFNSSTGS